MLEETMQILIYSILGLAIVFYVVLDGFDLGVGALQIFAGTDENRRVFLNSIGPFWDGNEVWLIIIGGLLFVGFPDVYAVIFSGFYTLMMCLLAGIIFRAVAIEFRSKLESQRWRFFWDTVFWVASLAIIFGAGLLIANILKGLPVDANRELYFSFGSLFSGYAILVAMMSIFLFTMHGGLFLLMKTEGKLQQRIHYWPLISTFCFYGLFLVATIWTWISYPYMVHRFIAYPLFWLVPMFLVIVFVGILVFHHRRLYEWAFLCSMTSISLIFLIFAIGFFPHLLRSVISPNYDLTLFNASASPTTMKITLLITVIGIPLVLIYGWILYRTFRGKTQLHDHSY